MTDLDLVSGNDYCKLMTGFTKLFSGIVYSTIWQEPLHTRVVWVTMLALADARGQVAASLPGLAKASGVTLDECQDALDTLQSPDKYSRSKEYEGRRIEEIDGGWSILNYLKYRELRHADERRIQNREAVARHRARVSNVSNVSHGKPKQKQKQKEKQKETNYTSEFEEFWVAYPSRAPGSNPKRLAADRFAKLVSSGEATTKLLFDQAHSYRLYCETTMREKRFIMQASSWLGEKEGWRVDYTPTWKWLEGVDDEVKRDLVGENLGRILNV